MQPKKKMKPPARKSMPKGRKGGKGKPIPKEANAAMGKMTGVDMGGKSKKPFEKVAKGGKKGKKKGDFGGHKGY